MTDRNRRNRRPIEREYLAALNEVVPVETWRSICEKAAADAVAGDSRARDWLTKWLLGTDSRPLTTLAAEGNGAAVASVADCEIERRRRALESERQQEEQNQALLDGLRF